MTRWDFIRTTIVVPVAAFFGWRLAGDATTTSVENISRAEAATLARGWVKPHVSEIELEDGQTLILEMDDSLLETHESFRGGANLSIASTDSTTGYHVRKIVRWDMPLDAHGSDST